MTWIKTIKMAINKIFNYLCWIMIACTLSIAFDSNLIAYSIMAVVYGLELMKCILRFVQSHGYKVSERQALVVFLKIVLQKFGNADVETEKIIEK